MKCWQTSTLYGKTRYRLPMKIELYEIFLHFRANFILFDSYAGVAIVALVNIILYIYLLTNVVGRVIHW